MGRQQRSIIASLSAFALLVALLPASAVAADPTPRPVPVGAVAAGTTHSVAIDTGGQLWSWGGNAAGQLGDGTTTPASLPVATSVTDVAAVDAGSEHTIAVRADGTVVSLGGNDSGQLGNGTTASAGQPVTVDGLPPVVAAAAGSYHSLALDTAGTVWAWGGNRAGQLGDGTTRSTPAPVRVDGLPDVVQVAAGGLPGEPGFSLALTTDGTVWGWGSNRDGQLVGVDGRQQTTPTALPGLQDVVAVAAGGATAYALTSGGTVLSWGDDRFGQLGAENVAHQHDGPVEVALDGVAEIAAGGAHALARTDDGHVYSWGNNNVGQLGADHDDRASDLPARVAGITGATHVAAGYVHSIVATDTGAAWAWGRWAEGQLGDGTIAGRHNSANERSWLRTPGQPGAGQPGRATPVQVTFPADPTPPEEPLTVTITDPTHLAAIDASDGLRIRGTATGGDTPLRTVTLRVDGQEALTEQVWGDADRDWTLMTVPPATGRYELEVTVTDEAGRQGSDTVTIDVTDVVDLDGGQAVVSPLAVLLDADLLQRLEPVDYPASVLHFAGSQVPFEPGDLLVADISDATPEGLLVRVLGIDAAEDRVVVTVDAAGLGELFLQADLHLDSDHGSQPQLLSSPAGPSNRAGTDATASAATTSGPACLDDHFNSSLNLRDEVTGHAATLAFEDSQVRACYDTTFQLVANRPWDWGAEGMVTRLEARTSIDANIGFDLKFTGRAESFNVKYRDPADKMKLPPLRFIVPAGKIPVPVVITNELSAQMQARGRANGSFTTRVSGHGSFDVGVSYDRARPEESRWEAGPSADFSMTFGRPQVDAVTYDVRVGPRLALESKLYGQGGVRMSMTPFARGVLSALDDDSPHFRATLNTEVGVEAAFPRWADRFTPTFGPAPWELAEVLLWEGSLGDTDLGTVLYFADDVLGTDTALAGLQQLEDEGRLQLEVATSRQDLIARLDGDPDLLVYFNQNWSLDPADEVALVDWIEGGNRTIYADWTWNPSVLDALQVRAGESFNHTAAHLSDPVGAGMSDPLPLTNPGWSYFSMGLRPVGDAYSACEFVGSTDSCLVFGNDGRTATVGWLNDTVTRTDGEAFIRNLVEQLQ